MSSDERLTHSNICTKFIGFSVILLVFFIAYTSSHMIGTIENLNKFKKEIKFTDLCENGKFKSDIILMENKNP